MNKWLRMFYMLLVALGFGPVLALAAPPAYTGGAFDQVQILADDGLLFFGVIIAAAIVITGFFLGRRWMKKI